MSNYTKIAQKLKQFSQKFYVNELIKGSILFISLGLLYLFFTVFIEYFLWLKPRYRTLLFWLFLLVEVLLLLRFIFFPIFKLVGLKNGISFEEASKIIGNHFPEVKDKLLNILQLQQSNQQSDLLLASIEQKSDELQPISFTKAVNFSSNTKYLKYTIIPFLIGLTTLLTGFNNKLNNSFNRLIDYKTAYTPPAPFSFVITNKNLQVIQGNSITVYVKTKGNVLPEEVKINFENQAYYMQNEAVGLFSYTFTNVERPLNFFVTSNNIQSIDYQINTIKTPSIQNVEMELYFPKYTSKKSTKLSNSGNTIVPQGTLIKWLVKTSETDTVSFINKKNKTPFSKINTTDFEYKKRVLTPLDYQISTSNKNLKDYDKLQFSVDVVKDEFPLIQVNSNIDSITRGEAQFAGKISDDYGFKKLELVYFDEAQPQILNTYKIGIGKENIQTFFYEFPEGIELTEGKNYQIYFQVFDNDAVNGSKKTVSKKFSYRQQTAQEIEEEQLKEQKNYIQNLENSLQNQQKNKKALEKFQLDIQNKKNMNWNDQKKIQKLLQRQEQYKQMMQRQTDKLQENFTEKKEQTEELQQKKQDLQKRIEELKKLEKQQKLLDELNKLAEKLNKEELLKKVKELSSQNKQQERSLERVLELTKRFYVEQKTQQIADKLEKTAKKQEELADKENNEAQQKEIEKEFNEAKKELEELKKDNEALKQPIEIPSMEKLKQETSEELQKAAENLENKKQSEAAKNQKKAAQKMKEMSQQMKKSMEMMSADMEEENMEGLRQILENLLTFSFDQEKLMNTFSSTTSSHPNFGKNLQKQHQLKTYFEHIDDSLFVLSMKVPKISSKIQDHLANAHYNLDQSLENFAENNFRNGTSNQQYVMTAANSLADMLSNTLDAMQNPKPGSGKGKGKGKSFSLPDIIQKQEELLEKMKQGKQKGKGKPKDRKNGEKKPGEGQKENGGQGENEQLNGELFQIYKEQSELRQQLENAIKQGNNSGDAKKALKKMEQLENEILEKGFNQQTINRMQQLNYELLKLDKATFEQNKDKKRKSNTNFKEFEKSNAKQLKFKKLFYNQTEILNRQSLPLRQNYKKKVQEYFNLQKAKE